jgi:hypothetical protein
MSNDITFNRGRGGLGRALAGKDHVSAIIVEMAAANIPSLLSTANLYSVLYSVQDAVDLGVVYSTGVDNLELDALVYAINSAFAVNSKAIIHLVVADTTDSKTVATELITLQAKASGDVRQALLIAASKDFAAGDISVIQTACDVLESTHQPLSVVYAPNFVGITMSGTDLRVLQSKNVSVCGAMDGNGKGNELFVAYNKTITAGGAVLGVISLAKVHENIAWVGRFNLNKNDTNEFDILKLADGRNVKDVSTTELDTLGTKGYIILKKHIGLAGSYFNDSYTASLSSSDYAYIENVRTIDKATRGCRQFLLPSLNAPLYVNDNGTLTEDTIASFKNDAERAIEEMQVAGEVSAFIVTIDPDQNVLTTSNLAIAIEISPVGVARNIVVNIGFAVKVTNV